MKLLLSFCFFLGIAVATFNPSDCAASFLANIGKILSLKQDKLARICANSTLKTETIGILRGMLSDCGLDQWNSGSTADIQVGSMIEGLFSFSEQILCSSQSDTDYPEAVEYCFPHAIKLLSLKRILNLDWNNVDFSDLDLKCSIMMDDNVVSEICPTGAITSGKHKCKTEMVRMFDMALRTVRRMLEAHPPNEVKSAFAPLLDFAVDVRMMCKESAREGLVALFKAKCAGETPAVPTDEKLAEEWCDFHSTNPGKNKVKKKRREWMATARQYNIMAITVPDGRSLELTFFDNLCCPPSCKAEKAQFEKVYESATEIEVPGFDLWGDWLQKSDEEQKEVEDSICQDQASNGGFNWKDCDTTITQGGIVTLQRRLFDTTTTLIATVNVNSTDTVNPITCQNGGSFYSFDSHFNTTTQADSTSCNCTQTCSVPDLGYPTTPSATGVGSGNNVGTGSSSTSGGMKLNSLSFGFLFCSFFTLFKL